MQFLISDTFSGSLGRLTEEEQRAVKLTVVDLHLNPANPGLSFHKLDKVKDKNFWSVRVNSDVRLIVHRMQGSLLLCYVDHHDKAYDWASRRKLEMHPKTGAAQLVELRETVKEIVVPVYIQAEKPPLFAQLTDDELLSYGVPSEWLGDVRKATEDTLLILTDHLPGEAAEALLELATGGRPRSVSPAPESLETRVAYSLDFDAVVARSDATPESRDIVPGSFEHPDAQRRFRVMTSVAELERALDYPWDKWTIFLHPEQRELVERDYRGPARVSGSAGTGKTIVALHRAAHLARANPDMRVLLTTFSDPLANALRTGLKRLFGNEPRLSERVDIHSLDAIGLRLYKAHLGAVSIADRATVRELIKEAAHAVGDHKFGMHFLLTEWEQVADAWQLENWEAYRDVARLGRKTRLSEPQRKVLWSIFDRVRAALRSRNLVTQAGLFRALTATLTRSKNAVFDFVIVDEAQDISVAQLRFLAALGATRPDALFFAGDLGQRIFQQPFSWKAIGVDVRGRSRTLRVNYRTSHQIRMQSDRLLGQVATDVDGITETRSDTVSVFNGPPPTILSFKDREEEIAAVAKWMRERGELGVSPHELAVFVRSDAQLDCAKAAVQSSGLPFKVLDEHVETSSGYVAVGTMHLAKGLEFRAVAVMACDDEIMPLQERIETVGDDADLQEVYDTERHLLYVACTRARDHLLVTGAEPVSEFLDDFTKAETACLL